MPSSFYFFVPSMDSVGNNTSLTLNFDIRYYVLQNILFLTSSFMYFYRALPSATKVLIDITCGRLKLASSVVNFFAHNKIVLID